MATAGAVTAQRLLAGRLTVRDALARFAVARLRMVIAVLVVAQATGGPGAKEVAGGSAGAA